MSTPYNRKIQAIVIHHMGDGKAPAVPISQRWNPHGYDYPAYDFGIEADGTIVQGRPLTYQGAHCLSDKPPYSQRGGNWWNKNAIGIGLAGDFTQYAMPEAQFQGLVGLVKKLMAQYGLTLNDVYPHGQVAYTDCPGCTYSKVPALKGAWSYDEFEKTVLGTEEEVEEVRRMKTAIVYFTVNDFSMAKLIADQLGCCGMFCRNGSQFVHEDALGADHLIVVGGPKIAHKNATYLAGNAAVDTAEKVVEYVRSL